MKKALIYDPYLDTLGGGERYTLTFALGLIKLGYSVDLAWKDENTLKAAEERFGLDYSPIHLNKKAHRLCTRSSILQRFFFTKEYDLIFWISDGSLPILFSKKVLIHFQIPFTVLGGSRILNTIKSFFVDKFVYNSKFTQKVIEKNLPKDKGYVLYPPIDTEKFTPGQKEKLILSVGRFDSPSHNKRQDVLIDAFRHLSKASAGYRLVLAGGLVSDDALMQKLKTKAKGLAVEFVTNPQFNKLNELFSKAKFFWHAAGFGVDENRNPEKVEHFGMTTVEAMSSGCIPIVISKGGQKEIITENSGFLCEDATEMAEITGKLIQSSALQNKVSKKAIQRAREFSSENFYEKIKDLI